VQRQVFVGATVGCTQRPSLARQDVIVCRRVHRRVRAYPVPPTHVLCGFVPGRIREPHFDTLLKGGSYDMLRSGNKLAAATMKGRRGGDEGPRKGQRSQRQSVPLTMESHRCRRMLEHVSCRSAPMAAACGLFLSYIEPPRHPMVLL
jgi:hypothetical protein